MAESAALLVDEVFPEQPVRQWVLSVPFPLRFLFARRPDVMGGVLGIVYRCIATHLITKAGLSRKTAQGGAVTLIDGARPCASPFGRPAVVQIGNPADWSALRQCAEPERPLAWRTSLCATLRATCGRANRQSCRFVTCCSSTVCTSSALTARSVSAG